MRTPWLSWGLPRFTLRRLGDYESRWTAIEIASKELELNLRKRMWLSSGRKSKLKSNSERSGRDRRDITPARSSESVSIRVCRWEKPWRTVSPLNLDANFIKATPWISRSESRDQINPWTQGINGKSCGISINSNCKRMEVSANLSSPSSSLALKSPKFASSVKSSRFE